MNDNAAVRSRGLAPETLGEMIELSKALAASKLCGAFDGWEKVLLVLMHGQEMGFSPTASLNAFFVVPGTTKISIYGDAVLGLLTSRADFDWSAYSYKVEPFTPPGAPPNTPPILQCTAIMGRIRNGESKIMSYTFSMADAARAGLIVKDGNWQKYPERMLRARTVTFLGRDLWPDVFAGIYTVEEMREVIEVQAEEPSGPLALPKARKAKTEPAPPAIEAAPVVVETDGLTEPQTAAQERFAAAYPDLPADTLRRFIVDSTRGGEVSFHAVESAIMAHTKGTN